MEEIHIQETWGRSETEGTERQTHGHIPAQEARDEGLYKGRESDRDKVKAEAHTKKRRWIELTDRSVHKG